MSKNPPSREIFDKLVDTPYPAFALVAGVKLDVSTPLGNLCEAFEERWRWALQTAELIRTGKPQAEHDYSKMSGDERGEFFRDIHPNALETGRMMVGRLGLADRSHLLDVRGESGHRGLQNVPQPSRNNYRATLDHAYHRGDRQRVWPIRSYRGHGSRCFGESATYGLKRGGVSGCSPGSAT